MKRKMQIELDEDDEVLDREVKKSGHSSHVILPQKHIGKKAKIIINKEKNKDGK